MTKVKKYILALLILVAAGAPFFAFKGKDSTPIQVPAEKEGAASLIDLKICRENILKYLKLRKDGLALPEIDKVLALKPNDLCALWAKAEVLRRGYRLKESEDLLNRILSICPDYASALISLAYIKYYNNEFNEGVKLIRRLLKQENLERGSRALAYVLLGSINAKRVSGGGLFSKITYGPRIRGFFEKAKTISPDLSEAHLALGSFYLLAPKIAGGNIDKAIEELEYAVKLTPDFATANARLAQAYNKKGDLEKYNFYIRRSEELDPQNETLREIKSN